MNNSDETRIPNFRRFVIQNFPFIEEDFDALTDYGLMSKVVEYLNMVINSENQLTSDMTRLEGLFDELHDYVENYFDNLNVQNEINHKLEVMANDGTLLDIMTPFLNEFTEQFTEDFNELSDSVDSRLNTINTKVNALTSMSPVAVSSVSDMTDTTKIYLLTTDGYWYYYDGTEWTAGGVYNSTPNALLSILGTMIAENTITKDKLSDKINILSKATSIQTNCSIRSYVSGTGPTIGQNTGTHVLTFPMSVLNDLTYFHIDMIQVSGNNICYVKYNSNDLTSYALTNYVALTGRVKEFNSTTRMAVFKKDTTYDTFAVTVDANFDIVTEEGLPAYSWTTGENIMINATNLITADTLVEGLSLNGYTTDHVPNESLDYRFNKVIIQLSENNKTLLRSAYFHIEDTPSEMGNRIILYKEGTGQTMYNLSYILSHSAYNATTKEVDVYKLCGARFDANDYICFYYPSNYKNFPVLYTTYVGPNNKNYNLLAGLSEGNVILPNKFKTVQGLNMCFYYQNFVTNANIDMIPYKGITNANINTSRVSWFNRDNVGTINCTFSTITNLQRNTAGLTHNFTFETVSKDAGAGTTKRCLMIGDSLTNNGGYTQRLLDLFADDPMDIVLLGTRGSGLNKHEGRGGWSLQDYNSDSHKAGLSNPFFDPTTNGFNFSYYMTEQGYEGVDYVFINLGTNDRGRQNSAIIEDLNNIIDSIKEYDSNIVISVWLPPARGLCENVDQDNLLETFSTLVIDKLFIDTYSEDSSINLIPVYTNINPYLDFPMVKAEISDTGSYDLVYTNNKVHPSVDGYYHIGDVIYAWIKFFSK